MKRTWVALVCVAILVITAAASVFFSTAGGPWLAKQLSDAAQTANPGWSVRLYRWALAVNPFDKDSRLTLARLYQQSGRDDKAEALLQEGVSSYAIGPDLYLALATLYVDSGRLEQACSLLDQVSSDYISRQLSMLRPQNAAAPPSGTYAVGLDFPLSNGEGHAWYQLNGGPWTLYGTPLRLQEGRYTLRVVTLDDNSIPSPVNEYRYKLEKLKPAAVTYHAVECPYCDSLWLEPDK